jgi:hypothetical protein
VRQVPNEAVAVDALKGSMRESGMYAYPWHDPTKKMTEAEEKAFNEAYKAGPTFLLVYNKDGREPMDAKVLGIEAASCVLAALVAALVACSGRGFFGRWMTVGAMGLFACLSITASYWNWWRFPLGAVKIEVVDQVGGWLIGGLAIALILRPRSLGST